MYDCRSQQVHFNYKFTGKERDPESGLDDFDARFYSSPFGRFMTPDWEAKPTDVPYANFGNPQSLNLYSYVQNNPTTVGDPDGHGCDICTEAWNEIEKLVEEGTKEGQKLIKPVGGVGGRVVGGAATSYLIEMINPSTTLNQNEQADKEQLQQSLDHDGVADSLAPGGACRHQQRHGVF